MSQGENICILENDFGAVNVDMMLLQDLLGEKCDMEMVAGGCDQDCHIRRFKTKLIAMGMCGYDRVIVEPSGIFDMDEFFDVLREDPLERWYQIDNVMAIVDANLEENLSSASNYILASQAANAGTIIFSKVQEAAIEKKESILSQIRQALDLLQANELAYKGLDHVIWKDWEQWTDEDFAKIQKGAYHPASYVKKHSLQEEAFVSLYYMNLPIRKEALLARIERLFADASYGHVVRVKGFLPSEDGTWIEINAVKDRLEIQPIAKGQEVIIVIGENLREEQIDSLLKS